MLRIVLLIFIFFISELTYSEEIKHQFMDGVVTINFNSRLIPRKSLQKYLVIHPIGYDSSFHISPSLFLCVDSDKSYFDCGSRDLKDPNFFKNAKVNISKGEAKIKYLSELTEYPELKELVGYFKSSLEFGVWQSKLLLKYYEEKDVSVLKAQYKSLKASKEIEHILKRLSKEKDIDTLWHLSFYKWANAVNHLYREAEGKVPTIGWNKFKEKYKLVEKVTYENVD